MASATVLTVGTGRPAGMAWRTTTPSERVGPLLVAVTTPVTVCPATSVPGSDGLARVWVTARSAFSSTVKLIVSVSLDALLSVVGEMTVVLANPGPAVAVGCRVALPCSFTVAPAARVPTVQALGVQYGGLRTIVTPAGTIVLKVTFVASDGPLLVTVSV